MKSKKALEIIEKEGRMHFTSQCDTIAHKAINQAESDARERAVKAFCTNCKRMQYRGCDGTAYCQEQWEYQNDYDNENS